MLVQTYKIGFQLLDALKVFEVAPTNPKRRSDTKANWEENQDRFRGDGDSGD
jgi:hypothetical protein